MKQKWEIRFYKEGYERKIFELWNAVYPHRKYSLENWIKWWNWLYKENPAGNSIICLAEDGGNVVGQYAIVPVLIKIDSETITCAQSLDTMTHPDYRRQGMFEILAKETYGKASKMGIHIIHGFPNEFSYPGFMRKLDWLDVSNMQLLIRPLNWKSSLKLKIDNKFLLKISAALGNLTQHTIFRTKKVPAVKNFKIAKISSFDDRIDDFWNEISNQYKIMAVRRKAYLNWRYRAPDANYSILIAEKAHKILGYIVFGYRLHRGVKEGHIFDLIAQSEEIMHCLISRSVGDCHKEKVDLIRHSLIANQSYQRVVRRCGFISQPFIKGLHFCVYSSTQLISREFLGNPNNWFVQYGDSDAL